MLSGLKQQHFLSYLICGSGVWLWLSWVPCLRAFYVATMKVLVGTVVSSEGLTGSRIHFHAYLWLLAGLISSWTVQLKVSVSLFFFETGSRSVTQAGV